jgi:hypothetical protein
MIEKRDQLRFPSSVTIDQNTEEFVLSGWQTR